MISDCWALDFWGGIGDNINGGSDFRLQIANIASYFLDINGDGMSEQIPVNPQVLRWARETANFSIEEVVLKLKRKLITFDTINDWEKGTQSPTYAQLEKLAYEIYNRPLALFFFPKPPEEETLEQSFRTLPEYEIYRLSPRLINLIKHARVLQINLAELNDFSNPASKIILHDLNFQSNITVDKMAEQVRRYIKIDLETQVSWKNADESFKEWRNYLEEYGIFVFKDAFKENDVSGFCLYEELFPIIYINNSMPHTRQIFTLFHELAHLLFRTGGVDLRSKMYIDILKGDNKRIEILCNKFAGAFLVPDSDFSDRIVGLRINDKSIKELANRYHVSREVILRKLLDRSLVTQRFYEKRVEEWANATPQKPRKGGNPYLNKGVYLGYRYLEMAFRKYYQRKINIDQLASYLGFKRVAAVSGMESVFQKQAISK